MTRTRNDSRALLFERIRQSPPRFVHVTGVPYVVELAPASNGDAPTQLWITLEAPPFGRMRAVINTISRLDLDAGGDARVRLAVQPGIWSEKPEPAFTEANGLDYAELGPVDPLGDLEPHALNDLLLARAKSAIRAEVWGDLYASDHLGIRQIHSRRASRAVKDDVVGRDGALRLYYADENKTELFLFKFAGQP